MSDELNAPQAIDATTAVGAPSDTKKGFLSTTGGKVVAIVVGLGLLGIIAGIAVAIVLYVVGGQAADEISDQIEQQVTETAQPATGSVVAEAEAPAPEVTNSEVFTFRNIFVPLIKPPVVETAVPPGTTSGTTTDSVTPTTQNTLYLDGVVTQNGVLSAVLLWNGQTYTLAPGGVIPNSPWEVLRVSSTSVTMLYGENQVTLSVGQGISK